MKNIILAMLFAAMLALPFAQAAPTDSRCIVSSTSSRCPTPTPVIDPCILSSASIKSCQHSKPTIVFGSGNPCYTATYAKNWTSMTPASCFKNGKLIYESQCFPLKPEAGRKNYANHPLCAA